MNSHKMKTSIRRIRTVSLASHSRDPIADLSPCVLPSSLWTWMQEAKTLANDVPKLQYILAPTISNGHPLIMGSVHEEDDTYVLRTFGLSLIDHPEMYLLFPTHLMTTANEIVRDLMMLAMASSENPLRPRSVIAARFGISYEITSCTPHDWSDSWAQFSNHRPFNGVKITFDNQFVNLINCASCNAMIFDDSVTCRICQKFTYCSRRCRANDTEHLRFCSAMKAGKCQMCRGVCHGH